jgi:hypothetical protein
VVETSIFISIDFIDQHLIQPTNLNTMIQSYMTKLEKDMSTLDDNMAIIEEMLEQLSYRRIQELYNQLEVWKAYL